MDELIAIGSNGLYGLLSRPDVPSTAPAVVLFNAGLVHRVGPSRLNVRLARALAAAGRPVLRFDLPGIGDAGASEMPWLAVAAQALDALHARVGSTHFVVGGLCTAADLAWQLALADTRVCGLLALDGLARRGAWFRLGQIDLLLHRPLREWPQILRRRMRGAEPDVAVEALRDWPDPGVERAQSTRLAARGVHMFALYTGGAAPYFLHRGQFRATFGALAKAPRAQLEFRRSSDHAFYAESDRRQAIASVSAWLERHCVA
jgi:hypothetical protein